MLTCGQQLMGHDTRRRFAPASASRARPWTRLHRALRAPAVPKFKSWFTGLTQGSSSVEEAVAHKLGGEPLMHSYPIPSDASPAPRLPPSE
jgi:hypothetical protein